MISLAVRGYIIEWELCSATCGKGEGAIVWVDVMQDIFDRQKAVIRLKFRSHVLGFRCLNVLSYITGNDMIK